MSTQTTDPLPKDPHVFFSATAKDARVVSVGPDGKLRESIAENVAFSYERPTGRPTSHPPHVHETVHTPAPVVHKESKWGAGMVILLLGFMAFLAFLVVYFMSPKYEGQLGQVQQNPQSGAQNVTPGQGGSQQQAAASATDRQIVVNNIMPTNATNASAQTASPQQTPAANPSAVAMATMLPPITFTFNPQVVTMNGQNNGVQPGNLQTGTNGGVTMNASWTSSMQAGGQQTNPPASTVTPNTANAASVAAPVNNQSQTNAVSVTTPANSAPATNSPPASTNTVSSTQPATNASAADNTAPTNTTRTARSVLQGQNHTSNTSTPPGPGVDPSNPDPATPASP